VLYGTKLWFSLIISQDHTNYLKIFHIVGLNTLFLMNNYSLNPFKIAKTIALLKKFRQLLKDAYIIKPEDVKDNPTYIKSSV